MTFRPCTAIMPAVAIAAVLTALNAPRANAQAPCQEELAAVQNAKTAVSDASKAVRAFAVMADGWQQQLNDISLEGGSIEGQSPPGKDGKVHLDDVPDNLRPRAIQLMQQAAEARGNMTKAAREGVNALATLAQRNVDLATAQQAYSQCLGAAIHAAADAPPAGDASPPATLAATDDGSNGQAGPTPDPNTVAWNPNQYSPALRQAVRDLLSAAPDDFTDYAGSNANTNGNAGTGAGGSNSGQAGPTAYNTPTSTSASDPTAGNAGGYIQQAIAALVSALTNNAGNNNNNNASTANNPPTQTSGVQPSNNGQAGPTAGNSPNTTIPPLPMVPPLQQGVDCSKVTFPYPTSGPCAVYDAGAPGSQPSTSTPTSTAAAPSAPSSGSGTITDTAASTGAGAATPPQQASCPSGYVNWSCKSAQGTTSGCLTPQDAASDTAQYTAMGYSCSTGSQPSPSTPTSTAAAPASTSASSNFSCTPTSQAICIYSGTILPARPATDGYCPGLCIPVGLASPVATLKPGDTVCPNGSVLYTATPAQVATGGVENCKFGSGGSASTAPLQLKSTAGAGTQLASAGSSPAQVQACASNPPFLPWGGHGSATITVSGGQACGVGWHDTPGGPGGVTVLDSMSVSSPPSHGTLKPQDQHIIIFTPTPGYKGPDSFTLSMQEHNGGRSATLHVKVSVTIQ